MTAPLSSHHLASCPVFTVALALGADFLAKHATACYSCLGTSRWSTCVKQVTFVRTGVVAEGSPTCYSDAKLSV